jgi:hypothetical protein
MARKMALGLLIIGLFMTAMFVMPVAAAPAGQAQGQGQGMGERQVHTPAELKNSTLDPALKEDLRKVHTENRLAQLDLNLKKAEDTTGVLEKYQYDTSGLSGILSAISEKRAALEEALTTEDRDQLKTVNKELQDLWKEFGKTLKALLKG